MMSWISGIRLVLGTHPRRRFALGSAVLLMVIPLVAGCGGSDALPAPATVGAWRLELAISEAAYKRLGDTESTLAFARKLLDFSSFCRSKPELAQARIDSLRRSVAVLDELGPGVWPLGAGHVIRGDYSRDYPKLLFDSLLALSDVEPDSDVAQSLALRALEVARSYALEMPDQLEAFGKVASAARKNGDLVLEEASLRRGIESGEARSGRQDTRATTAEFRTLGLLYAELARFEERCGNDRRIAIVLYESALACFWAADAPGLSTLALNCLHPLARLENREGDAAEFARLGLHQSMLCRVHYSNEYFFSFQKDRFEYFLEAVSFELSQPGLPRDFSSDFAPSRRSEGVLARSRGLAFVIGGGLVCASASVCLVLWRRWCFKKSPPALKAIQSAGATDVDSGMVQPSQRALGSTSMVSSSAIVEPSNGIVEPSGEIVDCPDDDAGRDVEYRVVSVQELSDNFESRAIVDLAALARKGLVPDEQLPLWVVDHGDIDKELTVFAVKVSGRARRKIERAGGAAMLLEIPVEG
jgi:hypothetical protein